jgi:hypothetical protein
VPKGRIPLAIQKTISTIASRSIRAQPPSVRDLYWWIFMADENNTDWNSVIGKSLAYFCLQDAERKDPKKFEKLLHKVKFLEGLGLSRNDAAMTAGSSPASVGVLQRRLKKAKHGKAKKRKGKR